jgi:hypothetical protein
MPFCLNGQGLKLAKDSVILQQKIFMVSEIFWNLLKILD